MLSSILFKAGLASLLAVCSASPLVSRGNALILPAQDPFYAAPEGFENTAPGTILRSRVPPAPLSAFDIVPIKYKAAYQLLYRTTSATGDPLAAVTTVVIPNNANMSRVVSYQDFEDAPNPNCAPSFALQQGSGFNTTLSKLDLIFEGGILAKGWVLVLPDYEGPQAALFSGVEEGQATLDSIRAVLCSQDMTGIAPKEDVDVLLWGYSGGSIATEWAAELQPSYAPELEIKGAVIGGTVANLTSSVLTINKGVFTGFAPSGILGLLHSYPDYTDAILSKLVPEKAAAFKRPLSTCAVTEELDFIFQDIFKYFTDGTDIISTPAFQTLVAAGGVMGYHGLPTIPLYFYKALADEISPVADNDKLVDMYCNMGINSLEYYRIGLGGHVTAASTGMGGVFDFMMDRFNGVPPQSGCKTHKVILGQPDLRGIFGGYGAQVTGIFEILFHAPIGPPLPISP